MDRPKQFMDSALVAWVKLFDDHGTIEEVRDIADGVIFHKIMNAVDPNTYGLTRVKRNVNGDISSRLQNLQLAVNTMTHFYITAQQQLVLVALPEISSIAHEPTSDKSLDELEKFIILLLGCAIQSDHKVQLIEQMKNMEVEQQQALIFYIQKITETTEFVCSLDWNDLGEILKPDLEALCRTAYIHLQRVAKERTTLFDTLVDLTLERDFYKEQAVPASDSINKGVSPSPQINPEVIELKKQARVYQEEIDRKTDLVNDLENELEQVQIALQKLTLEKRELLDDAKATRAYRDEVEALKVQNAKIEKLEADVVKYRQRAEDSEYLKKRVTELKQQNELMAETKTLLEQKVATLTSRADTVDDLQAEVASLKVQVDALNQEKQMDLERIEELVAQTARLELENKNNQEQIAQLMLELETERERMSAAGMSGGSSSETSLGFEMTEADLAQRAKLLRLEKETREMEKSMEALRHSQAKVAELEKTNKKLYSQNHSDKKDIIKLREEVEMLKVKASRVDKLQTELSAQREKLEEASRLQSRLKELKSRNEQIMESKAMLEDEVENLQGKIILLDVLKGETAQLKAQVDSLTSENVDDQYRIQELLEQNAQLEVEKQRCAEKIDLLTTELEQGGSKSDSLSSKLTVLTPPRVSETDMATKAKLQRLEKESKELEKSMETLRHAQAKVTELEKTNKKLNEKAHSDTKEIIRLKEEIHSYRTKTNRLERRQSSFKLNSSDKNEEMEAARGKIAELKQQNMLLGEAKALYEEELSSFHTKLEKLGELQGENAALKVRVSSLEQEKEDDSQRMQDLMQENAQLILEKDRNVSDMNTLKSELDKLKLAAASKASEVPYSPVGPLMTESELANRAKLLHLEKDHRDLQHNYDLYKQRTERVASEMEKTNQKLNTQIHNDRKEIVRLKEELKHEKDVASTLTRQVEHLQKMVSAGTNESPLGHVEQKKIEELGTKFDEALSQSLAIKEERISQLELRLEESLKENGSLRDDISALRKDLIKAQANKNGPISTSSLQSRETKEQLHEAIRLREKNAQMMAGITDCKHIIKQQQHKIDTIQERYEMLEQLNDTLEEEKKTLLLQVNKLLEQNQSLLMKTLESKDQALEEERVFSDRLDELEKDKARLSEQLISQQKESMAREIDMLRKREKSKNLLKKGLKKLKGKFQTRSHTFELPDTGLLQGAGSGTSFSPHHTLPAAYKRSDGSWSSNQSISSGSHHSDSREDLDHTGSSHDVNQLVPRRAALAGHSPVTLRQPKTQSLIVPPTFDVGSPYMMPERHNDIMSLEEFLAETNKTPNRRKLMEIKRASVATPPVTPRGSMLFGINNTSNTVDQAELQDFLRKFQADDALSIPEVNEEDDLDETGRLSSCQRSGRSCSSSGSTTQEETTCDVNSSSNNNNNNNNNNRSTPPIHPLLISSHFRCTANDIALDLNQERRIDLMPQNCCHNEVWYRSDSNAVVENRVPPSTSICVGGNIPSATASIGGNKLERKKFYSSLAELTGHKTTERHKKRHKSTENLLDTNEATLNEFPWGEEEPLPFYSRALSLTGLTTTNDSSSRSPSPEKNKVKRRLFKWRRSSQPVTQNQIPFQPLTEQEGSLQPFSPVPHLVSVHYV